MSHVYVCVYMSIYNLGSTYESKHVLSEFGLVYFNMMMLYHINFLEKLVILFFFTAKHTHTHTYFSLTIDLSVDT